MKITTALNHKNRLLSRLQDIMMSARISKPSHTELCERIRADILTSDAMQRCPSWVFEYITAYRDALFAELERTSIVWKVWFRGAHVIGKDTVPDGCWCEVSGEKGAFFWRDSTHVWIPGKNFQDTQGKTAVSAS